MKNDFVKVGSAYSLVDYDRIKMQLELNGVKILSENESTVAVQPYYANAIGGIEIYVSASDETLARQIVKSMHPQMRAEEYASKKRGAKRTLVLAVGLGLLSAGLCYYNGDRSVGACLSAFLIVTVMSYYGIGYALIRRDDP